MMPAARRPRRARGRWRRWPRSRHGCSAPSEVGRADREPRGLRRRRGRRAGRVDRRRPGPGRRPRLREGAAGALRAARRDGARPSRSPSTPGWRPSAGLGLRDAAARTWSATSSWPAATPTATTASRASSHPYDPLLDEYEPEMSTAQMRAVLARAARGAGAAGREATRSGDRRDRRLLLRGDFPVDDQRELVAELVGELPFPEDCWRLDPTDASLRDRDRRSATSG